MDKPCWLVLEVCCFEDPTFLTSLRHLLCLIDKSEKNFNCLWKRNCYGVQVPMFLGIFHQSRLLDDKKIDNHHDKTMIMMPIVSSSIVCTIRVFPLSVCSACDGEW